MIWGLVAFGGGLFWIFTVLSLLGILWFLQYDEHGSAFSCIAIWSFAIWGFTDLQVWPWIKENTDFLLISAISYLVIGAVWSLAKWYLFVLNKRDEYLKARGDWIAKRGEDSLNSPTKMDEFWRWTGLSKDDIPPKVGNHKARITSWISMWPFWVVETILGDVLARVFNTIYLWVSGLMQGISNKVFAGFSELDK